MAQVEVVCSKCGAGEYRVIDAKKGEVMCPFCHNKWVVSELAQKTETEKFLEEQAKQPRIIEDNTTETDKKLMDMVSGLAGVGPKSSMSRAVRTVLIVVGVIVFLLIACLLINIFGGLRALFG